MTHPTVRRASRGRRVAAELRGRRPLLPGGGLDQGGDGAGGVFDDAHAAPRAHVADGDALLAAQGLNLGEAEVEIGDGDIEEPLRGQVGVGAAGAAVARDRLAA